MVSTELESNAFSLIGYGLLTLFLQLVLFFYRRQNLLGCVIVNSSKNMSLNKYMHPRNPYRHKKPDFKSLALKYDFFRQFVSTSLSGKCVLDFKQPEALRALLKALLKEDFGIEIDIPVDR